MLLPGSIPAGEHGFGKTPGCGPAPHASAAIRPQIPVALEPDLARGPCDRTDPAKGPGRRRWTTALPDGRNAGGSPEGGMSTTAFDVVSGRGSLCSTEQRSSPCGTLPLRCRPGGGRHPYSGALPARAPMQAGSRHSRTRSGSVMKTSPGRDSRPAPWGSSPTHQPEPGSRQRFPGLMLHNTLWGAARRSTGGQARL